MRTVTIVSEENQLPDTLVFTSEDERELYFSAQAKTIGDEYHTAVEKLRESFAQKYAVMEKQKAATFLEEQLIESGDGYSVKE